MNRIACEMCGSNELIKENGVFICKFCGMQYSPEEAKKMMIAGTVDVQGTVKVDNSSFVEKYLANARRAKQKEDWEETEKYYNLVEQNDPTNIEAIFYSAYGKAKVSLVSSDIYKREAAFKVLNNSISVIDDNFNFNNDMQELMMVEQISRDIFAMSNSSYVYNYTKNGYGVTVKNDSKQTVALFSQLSLAFTESLDNINARYGVQHRDKKLRLLKLALAHCEHVCANGAGINFNAVQAKVFEYHRQIQMLDPSHTYKTEAQIAEELRNKPMNVHAARFMKIMYRIFAFIPFIGVLLGLIGLLVSKAITDNEVKKSLKTSFIISLVVTGAFLLLFIII